MKCKSCNGKLKKTGASFILKISSMLGYENYEFCSRKCFIKFLEKKFKLLKW